ncbi:MAG TPA: hemerythrin domain-containing protein [Burkholderiaceae bacterium]|nr:hemerythrin domain-containing protein [Burkholderiaceae bacterium]
MSTILFDAAPDFDQPIAVLKHCHDKIRKQLLTMQKLLDHLPEFGADLDAKQGATAILRYFNEAGPKHHADEEQDLLPMLQSTAVDDDAKCLNALMPEIMLEHQQMEVLWQSLALQLKQVSFGDSSTLSANEVEKFAALYTSHMEKEEANIAPMAKRLFTPAQMAQLGLAMRRRRGIDQ